VIQTLSSLIHHYPRQISGRRPTTALPLPAGNQQDTQGQNGVVHFGPNPKMNNALSMKEQQSEDWCRNGSEVTCAILEYCVKEARELASLYSLCAWLSK
jgi:hypothetical protein